MSEVLLHLHIPKVGGTTLRSIIFDQYRASTDWEDEDGCLVSGVYYFPWDVLAPEDPTLTDSARAALARPDVRVVMGHFWFGIHRHVPRPTTYITLLRDPADRLVSLYYLMVWMCERYGFPRGTGLHEFVTKPMYREVYNDQTRRIAGAEPGLGGDGRHVLEIAKENLRRYFSVIGTMERFDETLVLLKRRFGWQKSIRYYPERHNDVRLSVTTLPRKTLEAIRELNALDYELYEFANAVLSDAVSAGGEDFLNELDPLQFRQLAQYDEIAWQQEAKRAQRRALEAARSGQATPLAETP